MTEWLGLLELILLCMEVFYFGLFGFLVYTCFVSYARPFYTAGSLEIVVDVFLFIAYAILVFAIIPTYLYCNALIALVHVFAHNYTEIASVLPDITANDFMKLCVEGQPMSKAQVPPMNGHIVVAGKVNGQEYVCADLRQALSGLDISNWAKYGLNVSKNLLKIPDVLCAGVGSSQFPLSNKSQPKP